MNPLPSRQQTPAVVAQAGERVLQQCVFAHVEAPGDKLALLAGMVVKLWALVTGQCCEDSSDSALHQEVLLPGHLFCKALHERLSVWLAAFAAQVGPCCARTSQCSGCF